MWASSARQPAPSDTCGRDVSHLTVHFPDAFQSVEGILSVGQVSSGLIPLRLAGDRVAQEERYLAELGERIRDVWQDPDGNPHLLTDSGDESRRTLDPRLRPPLAAI